MSTTDTPRVVRTLTFTDGRTFQVPDSWPDDGRHDRIRGLDAHGNPVGVVATQGGECWVGLTVCCGGRFIGSAHDLTDGLLDTCTECRRPNAPGADLPWGTITERHHTTVLVPNDRAAALERDRLTDADRARITGRMAEVAAEWVRGGAPLSESLDLLALSRVGIHSIGCCEADLRDVELSWITAEAIRVYDEAARRPLASVKAVVR